MGGVRVLRQALKERQTKLALNLRQSYSLSNTRKPGVHAPFITPGSTT